jgi:DNA modification methylase
MTKSKQIVLCGDNIEVLQKFPDNYFDSICTDAPYGLGKEPDPVKMLQAWIDHGYLEVTGKGFMGKKWDAFVPQPVFWKEAIRVLNPGGHVLCFFGTRTYDWGVMAMRLAGFEIRDCIQWLYGSGFPKSLNISKAIDKASGSERVVVGHQNYTIPNIKNNSFNSDDVANRDRLAPPITASATAEGKQWEGWGTALKPANEPIVLARKPIDAGLTVADNVLKWGVGGINIDGCRVEHSEEQKFTNRSQRSAGWNPDNCGFDSTKNNTASAAAEGRFPANVILDQESGEVLDEQTGNLTSGAMNKSYEYTNNGFSLGKPTGETRYRTDKNEGGASRFFYCAKVSKSERNEGVENFTREAGHSRSDKCANCGGYILQGPDRASECRCEVPKRQNAVFTGNTHPTVKPVDLMRYLVKLITPPGGTCCDPFNGSGSTGVGCKMEGFNYVGIEQDELDCRVSEQRISAWKIEEPDAQGKLFQL